jgi:hypothetical protein
VAAATCETASAGDADADLIDAAGLGSDCALEFVREGIDGTIPDGCLDAEDSKGKASGMDAIEAGGCCIDKSADG